MGETKRAGAQHERDNQPIITNSHHLQTSYPGDCTVWKDSAPCRLRWLLHRSLFGNMHELLSQIWHYSVGSLGQLGVIRSGQGGFHRRGCIQEPKFRWTRTVEAVNPQCYMDLTQESGRGLTDAAAETSE